MSGASRKHLLKTIPRLEILHLVRSNAEIFKDKDTYSPLSNDPEFEVLTQKVFKNDLGAVKLFKELLTDPKAQKADRTSAKKIKFMIQSVLGALRTEENKKGKGVYDLPPKVKGEPEIQETGSSKSPQSLTLDDSRVFLKMKEEEIQVIVKYFNIQGLSPTDIKNELDFTIFDSSPSITTICKWVNEFQQGK